MDRTITLTVDGTDYVAIPKADYLRLTGDAGNDALAYTLASIGRSLRQAREHAGLTQAQLAKKIRKAQGTVSSAESGRIQVSERYVASVLRACGLPKDWTGEPR